MRSRRRFPGNALLKKKTTIITRPASRRELYAYAPMFGATDFRENAFYLSSRWRIYPELRGDATSVSTARSPLSPPSAGKKKNKRRRTDAVSSRFARTSASHVADFRVFLVALYPSIVFDHHHPSLSSPPLPPLYV